MLAFRSFAPSEADVFSDRLGEIELICRIGCRRPQPWMLRRTQAHRQAPARRSIVEQMSEAAFGPYLVTTMKSVSRPVSPPRP
jgi:hypothetical protein